MKDAVSHVKQVYVLGKTTFFYRPLDRSVMKGFKTVVSKQCSRHIASAVLKGLQEAHALEFDLSRLTLEDFDVGWVTQALDDDLRAERPEHFAQICALDALHHAVVPEQAPAEAEVAPETADPVMDREADDNVIEVEGLYVVKPAEEPTVEAVESAMMEAVEPAPIEAGETPAAMAAEPPPAAFAGPKKSFHVLELCIALRIFVPVTKKTLSVLRACRSQENFERCIALRIVCFGLCLCVFRVRHLGGNLREVCHRTVFLEFLRCLRNGVGKRRHNNMTTVGLHDSARADAKVGRLSAGAPIQRCAPTRRTQKAVENIASRSRTVVLGLHFLFHLLEFFLFQGEVYYRPTSLSTA